MRKAIAVFVLVLSVLPILSVTAQSSVKGMNARGVTGVILTPTARIGWEKSDFGVDASYSFLYREGMTHIPAVTVSLFERGEVALAYGIEASDAGNDLHNLMLGGKFQIYREGGTSLALGGNFETVTQNDGPGAKENSSDIYIVTTYSGDFFELPAVTSMMVGWQILEAGDISSSLNYSMGFEMGLFPETLKNYVYWISDFSNYSYAVIQNRVSRDRGIFNTGLRFDPIKDSKFKFVVNLIGTDLLDEDWRGFMANATFGMSF